METANKPQLIKDLGMLYPKETSIKKVRFGIYLCPICKQEYKTRTSSVTAGKSTKCKKCNIDINGMKKTHGMTNTRLYQIWLSMRKRCYKEYNHAYHKYGGRGIEICNEWLSDFMNFYDWAMTNGYEDDLTIDRINNNGNYEPNNCRWVNYNVQNANKGKNSRNTSGYKCVRYRTDRKHWKVSITINGRNIYLGSSKNKIECVKMYNDYVDKYNLPHEKIIL